MDRMIPLEQLAEERMKIMVDFHVRFSKTLLEAGVDQETVIAANAATWSQIGHQTAKALRPMFADKPGLFIADQLGAMLREMYGMIMKAESVPEGRRFRITHCPWRKRVKDLAIDNPHRFCRAGHRAFLNAIAKTLAQKMKVEMEEVPSGREHDCYVTIELFPKKILRLDGQQP